jgi:hypothetical protein
MDKENVIHLHSKYIAMKNKIQSFAVTRTELEGTVLFHINSVPKNTACSHSYVEFNRLNFIKVDSRIVASRRW